MFYHFEKLKVTLAVPKSHKKLVIIFLLLLSYYESYFEFLKMVKHNFWSVQKKILSKNVGQRLEK